MFNIKKEIFIVALILLLIVLVFITFFYDKKEDVSVLTPRESVSILNQENSLDLEVGINCNFRNKDAIIFVQEGDNSERIKVFYDNNGKKEKEIVYSCRKGKKVKDQERFYRENGMLDRVVGYVDCYDLGCVGHYNFLGLDGTRSYDNFQYKEGTKVYETFYHKEQLVKPKDLFPRNNAYKNVDYYEDGKTIYKETFYEPNVNNVSVPSKVIEYYENGAKYREYNSRERKEASSFYHPDGRKRIEEKEVYRRDNGSIERTKEWFIDGMTEYIEIFYDNNGNKIRESIRYEGYQGCDACLASEGATRESYYENRLFREDGTIIRLDIKFFRFWERPRHYKLVTVYGNYNNILEQHSYDANNDQLIKTRKYNIYDDILGFDKIINRFGITQKQKQNAIQNAGIFMSVCDYSSNGLVNLASIESGNIDSFFSVQKDINGEYTILRCGNFGYFTSLITSTPSEEVIYGNSYLGVGSDNKPGATTIYDDWRILDIDDFHYFNDFYKGKIEPVGHGPAR